MSNKKFFKDFELNMKYYFGALLNKPLVKPHWIYISLLHKCNLKCSMCGVSKILRKHELSFKEIKKILDEVASWKADSRIQLTGGEPLLRKDIFKIIKYSTSLKLITELVSNGVLINKNTAKKIIQSDLWGIAVSLDGSKPETHNQIRGMKGSFEKTVKGLKLLVEEKKEQKSNIQISIWTTIMNQNINELENIASLAEKIGVDCLIYHPVILSQTDMQHTKREGSMWVPKQKLNILRKQIDKLVEFKEKNGLIEFLHNPYWFVKYFDKTIRNTNWKCNPLEFIDIGPNGFVQSCGGEFGSIKTMTIEESMNTKKAELSRELMKRCKKPCLQTCWARPSADNLTNIFQIFFDNLEKAKLSKSEKKEYVNKSLYLVEQYEDMIKKEFAK